MIVDPSIAIQRALVAALKANGALAALIVAPGVYDRVPTGAQLDYVTLGADEVHDESAETMDGAMVMAQIQSWSQVSKAQAKLIGAQVMLTASAVLDLSADGQRCIDTLVEMVHTVTEPDGETFRHITTVKYLTEPLVQT